MSGISANFYDETLRYNYAFNNNIIEHRLDNGRMIQHDVPINEDNIDKYLAKGNRTMATSTKAETMAFFIALLLINEDKNFIIYTDSSNVIKITNS
ncbi:unnamed protein product [Rhizophagus irregularis]|nr:unnamed protein product [Rhizophagus irregularis]